MLAYSSLSVRKSPMLNVVLYRICFRERSVPFVSTLHRRSFSFWTASNCSREMMAWWDAVALYCSASPRFLIFFEPGPPMWIVFIKMTSPTYFSFPQHRGFDTSTYLHPYLINEGVKRGEGGWSPQRGGEIAWEKRLLRRRDAYLSTINWNSAQLFRCHSV